MTRGLALAPPLASVGECQAVPKLTREWVVYVPPSMPSTRAALGRRARATDSSLSSTGWSIPSAEMRIWCTSPHRRSSSVQKERCCTATSALGYGCSPVATSSKTRRPRMRPRARQRRRRACRFNTRREALICSISTSTQPASTSTWICAMCSSAMTSILAPGQERVRTLAGSALRRPLRSPMRGLSMRCDDCDHGVEMSWTLREQAKPHS